MTIPIEELRRVADMAPFSQDIRLVMAVELEQAARREGVYAILLHNRSAKRVLEGAAAAGQELAADEEHRAELKEWTGDGSAGPRSGIWASPGMAQTRSSSLRSTPR